MASWDTPILSWIYLPSRKPKYSWEIDFERIPLILLLMIFAIIL